MWLCLGGCRISGCPNEYFCTRVTSYVQWWRRECDSSVSCKHVVGSRSHSFSRMRKLKEMAAYIDNSWGPPQCIGAIDGSHIPILAPQKYQCDNFNRKGWHSIILQEVVDGKGLFWSVYSGMFGSLHNARALILSTFTPFPPNQLWFLNWFCSQFLEPWCYLVN